MGKGSISEKKKSKFHDINTFLGNQFKKYKNKFTGGKKQNNLFSPNSSIVIKRRHHNNKKLDNVSTITNGTITPCKYVSAPSRSLIEEQRKKLPVFQVRRKIIKAVEKHATVIFIGETASGKTTQIPQFILESKVNGNSIIAVTQPRRVAAISIATRVAFEHDSPLGQVVGYSVRFEEKVSSSTKIKYMTDGMLLREAITDPLLTKYSVVILDEAHERSIQTDVLFGIVKRAQKERISHPSSPPLKLIVMSATMNVDHFSQYFDNAPVYYLEGRQFPIEHMHVSVDQDDYIQTALITVLQIHRNNEEGDILVFCTGQEEINSMVSATRAASNQSPPGLKKLIPLPLHASLPSSEQMRVFQPSTPGVSRKVIFSTNVAETSLTIPGIRYVVDTCRVKARNFDSKTGFESLRIERISKAQAEQRAGRAGREGPGICYRLLTQEEFSNLKPFSIPEILRVNLSNVALQLIAIGIKNPATFDFMDKPKKSNLRASIQELLDLEAIEVEADGQGYVLTQLGKEMVVFPLDPKFSRILVASRELGCPVEIITIISILYVDSIFYVPPQKRDEATNVLKKFVSSEGDHIMMLNVFRAYTAVKGNRDWCQENFIHMRNMEIVKDVRYQLMRLWESCGYKLSSCGSNTESVRRCLLKGLLDHFAVLTREGAYRTVESKEPVYIHPSSCLFGSKPEFIVYTELVQTTKYYMRNVGLVSLDWLPKRDTP